MTLHRWSDSIFFDGRRGGGWRERRSRGPRVREVNREGEGDKRNAVIEYGGVWRSARTTRSICMLGDVDHVGRGWPATPGSWLASGHPNATPTPTHAVLNPPRATQPPCTSTEASPQPAAKLGERETAGPRGWGGLGWRGGGYVWVAQRDSTYYPLTLLPNSVESSRIENRLSRRSRQVSPVYMLWDYTTLASLLLPRVPFPIIRLNTARSQRRKLPEVGADAPEGRHYGFTGRHTRPGRNRPETISREIYGARSLPPDWRGSVNKATIVESPLANF